MLLTPMPASPSPLIEKMSRLDEEMKRILDRSDLDDKTKAHEYSQVLGQYLATKEQYSRPVPIPIAEPTPVPTINTQLFPQNSRRKAEALLDFIKDTPGISWNDRRELVLDGKTLHSTNVVDLIDDLSRPLTKKEPRGIEPFVQALTEANVPTSYVANRRRLDSTTTRLPPTPPVTPETPKIPRQAKRKPNRWDRW